MRNEGGNQKKIIKQAIITERAIIKKIERSKKKKNTGRARKVKERGRYKYAR